MPDDGKKDAVLVSVKDYGIGMDQEGAMLLFGRYEQLTSSEGMKGTGLGLSIAKAIIEMHGGRIWVKTMSGEGSTFSFALPVGRR